MKTRKKEDDDGFEHHQNHMGLTIKIRRTYYYEDDECQSVNILNCKYKLIYGNELAGVRVKIGTIEPSNDRAFEKYLGRKASTIGDRILMSSILVESTSAGAKKLIHTFRDGRMLGMGDFLEIQCYRTHRGLNRYACAKG